MKLETANWSGQERSSKTTVAGVCRDCYRKVSERVNRAKEAVLAEWSNALKTQQHAVRLALNEAEALAWETMYPHLVFPTLATEKVQAVAAWSNRQQRVRWANSHLTPYK